jgi:hypothetical protein
MLQPDEPPNKMISEMLKEARYRRLPIVCFHLFEIFRVDKHIQMECTVMIA